MALDASHNDQIDTSAKETVLSVLMSFVSTMSTMSIRIYPHLSRRAILARQTISATGAIVATVPTAKEISYRASCVWHHVTLPRHSVRSLPGTGGENEEEVWSPAFARGSSESSAVAVRAAFLCRGSQEKGECWRCKEES